MKRTGRSLDIGEVVTGALTIVVGVARIANRVVGGGIPAQIATQGDTDVVVLEALRDQGAGDLVDASCVGRWALATLPRHGPLSTVNAVLVLAVVPD